MCVCKTEKIWVEWFTKWGTDNERANPTNEVLRTLNGQIAKYECDCEYLTTTLCEMSWVKRCERTKQLLSMSHKLTPTTKVHNEWHQLLWFWNEMTDELMVAPMVNWSSKAKDKSWDRSNGREHNNVNYWRRSWKLMLSMKFGAKREGEPQVSYETTIQLSI